MMAFEVAALRGALLGRDGKVLYEIIVDPDAPLAETPGGGFTATTARPNQPLKFRVNTADLLELWEIMVALHGFDVMAVLGNEGVEFVPPFYGPWP